MDCVCDVGRGGRHPTRRSHADAHGCDDEGCSCCEGCQNEARDSGDGPRHAGHPAADTGRDRFLMKGVGGVGQSQELQDALLQRGAALVEKADKKSRGHEDAISCLLHNSDERKEEKETRIIFQLSPVFNTVLKSAGLIDNLLLSFIILRRLVPLVPS